MGVNSFPHFLHRLIEFRLEIAVKGLCRLHKNFAGGSEICLQALDRSIYESANIWSFIRDIDVLIE